MKQVKLREAWAQELTWVLTDNKDKTAKYSPEQLFNILSAKIMYHDPKHEFKRLSVSLSDYLKMTDMLEEISSLELINLAISLGYYYKVIEKNIVSIEEVRSEEYNKSSVQEST